MKLKDFIEEYGVQQIADVLGVTRQLVYTWDKGEYPIPPACVWFLNKCSRGKLSYNDAYDDYMDTTYVNYHRDTECVSSHGTKMMKRFHEEYDTGRITKFRPIVKGRMKDEPIPKFDDFNPKIF